MIPASLRPDGFTKVLHDTLNQLESRLKGKGARIFHGLPDPDNLPDDPYQVWLAPGTFDGNDNGSPKSINQTSIWTQWTVVLLRIHPSSAKAYGSDLLATFEDMGRFGEALTDTVDDMTLSGNIEWMDEPRGQLLYPPGSSVGSKRVTAVEFTLGIHHGPMPTRQQIP